MGEGSGALQGSDAFTVQAALEFTATLDGGGADTSDVFIYMYDAPITCTDVFNTGGTFVPQANQVAVAEARNILGLGLNGGDYAIPQQSSFGIPIDDDAVTLYRFFPDGGYSTNVATGGNLHYNSPVNTTQVTGTLTNVLMQDSTLINGAFTAPFCGTVQ